MTDNVLMLVQAALSCNRTQVKKYAEEIAREEYGSGGKETAGDIRKVLSSETLTVVKQTPEVNLRDLILSPSVAWSCVEIADEQKNAEVLKKAGLVPRNKFIIFGADGNGKESLGEGIAKEIGVPIVKITYADISASMIDEMAARLREIIDEAAKEKCVLYFDRIDLGTKEQIKRILLSVIKKGIPENLVFITSAVNYKDFDKGLLSVFDGKIHVSSPSDKDYIEFLRKFEEKNNFSFKTEKEKIIKTFLPNSFSEIKDLADAVYRRSLIEGESANVEKILAREIRMRM